MPAASRPRPTIPAALRAQGLIEATFMRGPDGRTLAASLEEGGGYRMRFRRRHARRAPRQQVPREQPPCEGAVINTGGGMAGGDSLRIRVTAEEATNVVLSTPAAERVYGSAGPDTTVDIALRLAAGARLAWLPQETILFGGARLARRLEVEMVGSATLILAEAAIFGRAAMGETLGKGLFADRWRIRRDGCLMHAEQTRLDGPIAELLARKAIGDGARAVATAAIISPDAEDRIDAARAALLGAGSECGVSAWKGMLLARFAAQDPALLRADLVRFLLVAMRGELPRLWALGRDMATRRGPDAVEDMSASMPECDDTVRRQKHCGTGGQI
ncbi:urease accessory protein [Rhizobiales bacterium GAS188]|nr:urease accessory protein [Rhizobiales bacterium GAS188]